MTAQGVRFAPSPTGRFHLGNLRTAWISWEWARVLEIPWVLRFEDIDQPRVVDGAQQRQLDDLRVLGCEATQIHIQSASHQRHFELFERARVLGKVYPCTCSRKELSIAFEQMASAPHGHLPTYHGRCRPKDLFGELQHSSQRSTMAWRFRSDDPSGKDDFIVGRTSREQAFLPSYQWACAIDDFDGAYDLIVRAWDLESVLRDQQAIHQWLQEVEQRVLHYPAVFHTTLVTGVAGARLEKRTLGVTLPELIQAGLSPSLILEKFQNSFKPFPADFSPGRIWGELNRKCALPDLGFDQQIKAPRQSYMTEPQGRAI